MERLIETSGRWALVERALGWSRDGIILGGLGVVRSTIGGGAHVMLASRA
jgi:hypothetical protein